jgi:phenylacetate-CoA ligase
MDISRQLIRNVVWPLVVRSRGESAELRYLREFERTQFLPADEIRALQLSRLRTLLDHAYRRCRFHRERFDRVGITPSDIGRLADLSALPVLEKHDIQQQRDAMLAEDWPRDDLIANQTGGSTGQPLSFFLSRDRKCSRAAATIRHNRWAGWDVGDKVACIWGAPRDLPPPGWRSRFRNVLLDRQLFLDTGHVTEVKLIEFYSALGRFRPRVLLAYARGAVLLARYLRANGLQPFQPHCIVTSAEVLEPEDRKLLEDVFGCRVFDRYGCREVSVVASECPARSGLHIMAEGLIVEVVRRDGSTAEPGEVGSILVTDLLNLAMPLIRYRIGDLGSWDAGLCSCGRELPRLRGISGRVTDFLVCPDGRLVSGVFLATYVIAQRPSLGQIQVHQNERGKILFRIRRGPEFREVDDLGYLEASTRRYLGAGMTIEHEFVNELEPEPSGKFLFSRSSLAPEYLWQPCSGPRDRMTGRSKPSSENPSRVND